MWENHKNITVAASLFRKIVCCCELLGVPRTQVALLIHVDCTHQYLFRQLARSIALLAHKSTLDDAINVSVVPKSAPKRTCKEASLMVAQEVWTAFLATTYS